MITFGLGRMDCANCFKTENDWCPAIIVPVCTMNCGPAVSVNGVQLAEQAPRGSEANRIKWENLERNAKWFGQTYDGVQREITDFQSGDVDHVKRRSPLIRPRR